MGYIIVTAFCFTVTLFLLSGGWHVVGSGLGIVDPRPIDPNLTRLVIPFLVTIDAAGLCVLIVLTGGAHRSLFTPLLFSLPVLATILSQVGTRWYLYFVFIFLAYLIALFGCGTALFRIERMGLYKGMFLLVAIISMGFTVISYMMSKRVSTDENSDSL